MMKSKLARRSFLQFSAFTGAGILLNPYVNLTDEPANTGKSLTILFQGDSITDGNRGRTHDPNHIMGHGYAFSIAGRVGADFASAGHQFYNRGISGNKITDLKSRWERDALELKPDVISILVGINDISGFIKSTKLEEEEFDQFENTYRELLQQSRQLNPGVLLVLCLPFAYPVSTVKNNWEKYHTGLVALSIRIKKLAKEFNALLIDFPAVFDKAFTKAPVEYWIWDGIHPTVPAHELMARAWIAAVSKRLTFLKKYNY